MIFHFPRLETLSLAIAGGHIPATTVSAPCRASFGPNGAVAVEASFKLAKGRKAELFALGVMESDHHLGVFEELTCWLQAFSLQPVAGPPQISQQAPILFELPDAAVMAEIVQEILRLGNDRQSFRAVAGANGETRILLRVIGPPYYTLLRATERFEGNEQPIRAYVEPSPRVWVEIGYKHPFASRITLAENRVLFLSAPRSWDAVPDAPFRDIYELLQFPLPHAPIAWADAGPGETITVPLRLAAGTATEVPEFWVLPEHDANALDAFVRDADERLLRRLRFAVAVSPDGVKRFALHVIPSKLAPPALTFPNAVGYKPYWNLPNLFVPAGQRLHPPLRRETVRRMLADDRDRATWLAPDGKGGFTPYSVPFDAFRPLEDWVNYIIDANAEPITEWIAATTFDFDSFICVEAPPKPGGGRGEGKTGKPSVGKKVPTERPIPPVPTEPANTGTSEGPSWTSAPNPIRTPSEWERRRSELEAEFLGDGTGPIDSPNRTALWLNLAACNSALGANEDAALCYWSAMAANPDEADAIAEYWIDAEWGSARPFDSALFDELLSAEPTKERLRTVAAAVLALADRLEMKADWPSVQQYLARNDSLLPVRAAWLVAVKLAGVAGADSLGLARTRDRLLARLFEGGINPERDLPAFLRYAGLQITERMRVIREKALNLHATVRAWVEQGLAAAPPHAGADAVHTPAFVDLAFAFAFARIQNSDLARQLTAKAAATLGTARGDSNPFRARVLPILEGGFQYRIERALEHKPHAGPLSPDLQRLCRDLQQDANTERTAHDGSQENRAKPQETLGLSHQGMIQLLEVSRILNPQERIIASDIWTANVNPLHRALWQLQGLTHPPELVRTIRNLLTRGIGAEPPDRMSRLFILQSALAYAGRVDESFAAELLERVPDLLPAANDAADGSRIQGRVLERALLLAAHFDRRESVDSLVSLLLDLARSKRGDALNLFVNTLGTACFRSLMTLNQQHSVERLIDELTSLVLKGRTIPDVESSHQNAQPRQWADMLQTLLILAGNGLPLGREAFAQAVLGAADRVLSAPFSRFHVFDLTRIIQATIATLSSLAPEIGLVRIESLIRAIPSAKFVHPLFTQSYYSRLHYVIAESVVMALASDEALGETGGRRWRDDEEYLIRRRIHADVRALCGTA
jgi:hypothetical protein